MKKIITSTVAALFLATGVNAAEYVLDKAHSSIGFEIKHMQISKVRGNFTNFDGAVSFDPKTKKLTNLNGEIVISSINTNNNKRDDHLRSVDYFDVEKFPTMKFEMTEFIQDKDDDEEGIVKGNLTIKGVTKVVEFEYELGGTTKTDDGKTLIGLSLEGDILRTDFNIGEESVAMGNKVKMIIELEAKEK
ncbi:YceI-like domain-containing periplasmic protein [Campylobacter blaseri]|uniref:Polyisoprenoid-binding protein n=1 Tax=Campylobacter blaseri TaxID=2042961 RepID=A0A2P8R2D0_9BACT|nr:YceI family protein [Campylobacter blaseri]PSM52666.1 polyisoprenoid-binding protein [Campylobacter blaseri]PSM54314.1 polyisoprenoid-binding protein [Campylobacter blaseri]QKF85967.1 YceI-like domain-containing periplasmic protein [Campylobacter blaseri]